MTIARRKHFLNVELLNVIKSVYGEENNYWVYPRPVSFLDCVSRISVPKDNKKIWLFNFVIPLNITDDDNREERYIGRAKGDNFLWHSLAVMIHKNVDGHPILVI
jgi:hypothetical protein